MEKTCPDCRTANPESAVNCGRCGARLNSVGNGGAELKFSRSPGTLQQHRNEELKSKAEKQSSKIEENKKRRKFRNFATVSMVLLLMFLALLVMPFGWDAELLPLPEARPQPLSVRLNRAAGSSEASALTVSPAEASLFLTGLLHPFKNVESGIGFADVTPRVIVMTDYPSQTVKLIRRDSAIIPIRREIIIPAAEFAAWSGATGGKFGSWPAPASILNGTRDAFKAHAMMQKLLGSLDGIEILPDGNLKLFLRAGTL